MTSSKNSDEIKDIISKFAVMGTDKFKKTLLINAIYKLTLIKEEKYKGISPEIEYNNFYNKFLTLFRREATQEYLEIAGAFRQVAHEIYRIMLSKKMTEINNKFLNLVVK